MYSKIILAAAGAIALFSSTQAAHAEIKLRNVNLNPHPSAFAKVPDFEMYWKGNKLAMKGKHFAVPFEATADINNARRSFKIHSAIVKTESIFGQGAYMQLMSHGYETRKFRFRDSVHFNQGHLKPVVAQAKLICGEHLKSASKNKSKKYNIAIPLKLIVGAHGPFGSIARTDELALQTKVKCPAAKSPTLTSGSDGNKPTRTNPFTVKKADLSVTYGPKACPQLVVLQARFETNKPGNVQFRLRDNKGGKSVHTIKAKKVGNKYIATYKKSFKSKKPIIRKYMVETTKFAKASAWKSVKVKCGLTPNSLNN